MRWKSSKKDIIMDFTTELEYISASGATKDNICIKKFVIVLGVAPSGQMEIYCENDVP
jgi:hypothetical protein